MKHQTSRELYEYWNRVRGPDPAPQRSAIEPSDIRAILADTFIAEAAAEDHYPIRLAGTRVCALYGREIKGANLLAFLKDEDRSALTTLAGAVADDGAAAVLTLVARTEAGDEVPCEMILLPLRHGLAEGRFERILGSLAVLEQPDWLGDHPVISQRIASLRLIWPEEHTGPLTRRSDAPSEIRAAAAPVSFPTKTGRKHGHLYVVDGGKK